jgi:hypothetical protein
LVLHHAAPIRLLRDQPPEIAHQGGRARVRARLADRLAKAVPHVRCGDVARIGIGDDLVLPISGEADLAALLVRLPDQAHQAVTGVSVEIVARVLHLHVQVGAVVGMSSGLRRGPDRFEEAASVR